MKKVLITATIIAALAIQANAAELEKQEVYNANDIIVTARAIEDSFIGTEIKMEIENNSAEDIIVQYENVCINGYMVNSLGSDEVASGKKAIGGMSITKQELEHLDDIATIQFAVKVLGTGYERKDVSDIVTVTAKGMEGYEQVRDDSGEVMVDNDICKIVFKGIEDSFIGKEAVLYIENKTDDIIIVQSDDTSVNGYMINTLQSCTLLPHACALDNITYLKSYLEESYIDDIEEIECSFHASGEDVFKGHIMETDPISVAIK